VEIQAGLSRAAFLSFSKTDTKSIGSIGRLLEEVCAKLAQFPPRLRQSGSVDSHASVAKAQH